LSCYSYLFFSAKLFSSLRSSPSLIFNSYKVTTRESVLYLTDS
jgi:hypothetical protein